MQGLVWFADQRWKYLGVASFAAVVALSGSSAWSQEPIVESGFRVGVGGHFGPEQSKDFADYSLARLKELGVTSYRQDFFWEWLEKEKGNRDIGARLSMLDRFIKDVQRQGIEPLIVLAYGNDLYDKRGFPLTAEAQDAFVAYATAIATHYKGIVKHYELWNEWNIGGGSKPRRKWGDSADYAKLLAKVYPALKAVDPQIVVLSGATSGMDIGWSKIVWKVAGPNTMDGFSFHPYSYADIPENILKAADNFESEAQRATGRQEVPLYITEIGWPTHQLADGTDPQLVGDYLARFYLLAATRPFIKGVWWYDLLDDGADPRNPEHNFGLFHRPNAKPAACDMTQVSKLLTTFKPVKANRAANGAWVVKLSNGNQNAFAVWTQERDRTLNATITSGSGNAAITGKGLCKEANISTEGNSVTVTITRSPLVLYTTADEISIQ